MYCSCSSQYADIRPASLQAAEDLYGENSVEVQTVAAAWDAVGVYENGVDPTGIIATQNDKGETKNDIYYDLQGRKVANPTHGLFIVNGKKVFIK